MDARKKLFEKNLYDSYAVGEFPTPPNNASDFCVGKTEFRTLDGTCNDLAAPMMGSKGMRFGRNVPLASVLSPSDEELITPNPRLISQKLLQRDIWKPAPIINLLVAAWIQFQTHDWFSHGPNDRSNPINVPVPDGDPLKASGVNTIVVPRTAKDDSNTAAGRKTFRNSQTHWWDMSQIYG